MATWFEEFLWVLAYSKRTQWAIYLGVIGFFTTLAAGKYFVGQLVFEGFLAPLTEAVRDALIGRYDKAAWSILGSFLILAFKCYQKDRKRLMAL